MASFPALAPGSDGETGESLAGPASESDAKIKAWCNAAFEEAEGDQKAADELKMVGEYVKYLQGTQWPMNRPSYRAKPVNNRMNRLFWELVSTLTDIRPVVDVRSVDRGPKMIAEEETINNRMRIWWSNNDIDQKVAMNVVYAILTTSFAKLEWDPKMHMGRGDFVLHALAPDAVLPLKAGTDLQSGEACIYQDIKSVGQVQRKYPLRAHLVYPDSDLSQYSIDSGPPKNITPNQFAVLSPAMRQVLSRGQYKTGSSAYPVVRYREFWMKDYQVNESNRIIPIGDANNPWKISYKVKPGEMLYPRGRLIVMAGKEIVHDGPNPYWHGLFPFSLLRMNVVPWSIYGMSDLRQWKDLQDIINSIFAGVIDMIKRATNPPFFAPKTAFNDNVWDSIDFGMPGAKVAYNAMSPQEPRVVNVAPLPGFVLPMLQNVEREMDQQSGISAISEMLRKKQMPGGDTVDQIRQTQQTPIRLKGRNIETFLKNLGTQMVPNMFQFYSQPSRATMRTVGGGDMHVDWNLGTMVPPGMTPYDMAMRYEFQVMEGSLLSFQRTEMAINLMRMRITGDLDRKTYFAKLSQLGLIDLNADTVQANLQAERQAGTPLMGSRGASTSAVQQRPPG